MSNNCKFKMDFSDFDKKFLRVTSCLIPDLADNGLFQAGNELLRDADNEAPQTPFKEGHLRGAGQVEPQPGLAVEVGYNSEYAAHQHEAEPGQFNYTITPGAVDEPGPKFLESKMVRHKDKYMAIVAEVIRKGS